MTNIYNKYLKSSYSNRLQLHCVSSANKHILASSCAKLRCWKCSIAQITLEKWTDTLSVRLSSLVVCAVHYLQVLLDFTHSQLSFCRSPAESALDFHGNNPPRSTVAREARGGCHRSHLNISSNKHPARLRLQRCKQSAESKQESESLLWLPVQTISRCGLSAVSLSADQKRMKAELTSAAVCTTCSSSAAVLEVIGYRCSPPMLLIDTWRWHAYVGMSGRGRRVEGRVCVSSQDMTSECNSVQLTKHSGTSTLSYGQNWTFN